MEENANKALGTVKRLLSRLHNYDSRQIEKRSKIMNDNGFRLIFKGNMSLESERRDTFVRNGWYSDVSASDMSSAGFCCVGNDGPVVCFQCKGSISYPWELGDIPLKTHRKMFPKCTFAKTHSKKQPRKRGRVAFDAVCTTKYVSENVSSCNAQTEDTAWDNSSVDEFFSSEYNRLMTFQAWPEDIPVKGPSLAAAGFYRSDDSSDRLKCFACLTEIGGWRDGGVPMVKHINKSPRCPFVNQLDTGNRKITGQEKQQAITVFERSKVHHPTYQYRSSSNRIVTSPSDNLFRSVRHKRYCKEEDRMKTYALWPKDHCQEPETLARAGFFSVGKEDRVACFFCGGELLDWDPDDNPFEEHARHYPDCRWVEMERSKIRVMEMKNRLGMKEDGTENSDEKTQQKTTTKDKGLKDEEEPNPIEYEPEEEGSGKRALLPGQIQKGKTNHLGDSPKRYDTQTKTAERHVDDICEDESFVTHGVEQIQVGGETTFKPKSQNKANLEAEVEMLRDQNLCKVCLDQDVEILFLPCKHLSVCETCAERVKLCPICREYIDDRIYVFVT